MKVVSKITTPVVEEGRLRVAFASKDGISVNDHFGWAQNFVLYDISATGVSKAGRIGFSGEELDQKGNDDKLTAKIDALETCHIIYSQAIGGPAAARLIRRRIQPMVVKDEASISALCNQIKETLNGPMPPWLRKITKTEDPDRFKNFDDEDDD